MYQSDFCITLDELPGDWANYKSDPTDPTESDDDGFIPGDVTGDKKINVLDSIALKRNIIYLATHNLAVPIQATPGDVNGDGGEDISDLVLLNKFLIGQKVTFKKYSSITD